MNEKEEKLMSDKGDFHIPELYVITTLVEKTPSGYERITDLSLKTFDYDRDFKKPKEEEIDENN